MKSLRDEIPLRGEKDAADLISPEASAEDFIRATLGFHRALRDFINCLIISILIAEKIVISIPLILAKVEKHSIKSVLKAKNRQNAFCMEIFPFFVHSLDNALGKILDN
ncbi:MAG: hypothetical protein ACI3XI_07165 [Eubacteriales bacterium]